MKKIFSTLIIFLLFTSSIFAADEIEKGKILLKSLSKKSLTKKETISFLKEYAVIVEDERGDGKVTYIFDDEKYSRYKGTEIVSTDAWRFSKLGALRLFNKDIKMTWKIKISDKENLINIKTKFDPVGKLYEFEVKTKNEFLDQIEQIKQAEIQKKEAIEKAKIKKQKKLEQEKLAAEQKLEEEKRKLEEEKIVLQKELEELKKKKAEELEQSEKTPVQLKKEERDKKKKEKLIAQKKAKEEKERLKQEKLAAQKKANEENKKNIKKNCKKYWDQCKDTDEFVQKYNLVSKIRKECKERSIQVAKYGKPKLPFRAFKNYDVKGMFIVKEDGTEYTGKEANYKGEKKWIEDTYLNRGKFKLTEIGQYQNVMGVSWDHLITCEYDLKKNRINYFDVESAN